MIFVNLLKRYVLYYFIIELLFLNVFRNCDELLCNCVIEVYIDYVFDWMLFKIFMLLFVIFWCSYSVFDFLEYKIGNVFLDKWFIKERFVFVCFVFRSGD